MGIFDKLRGDSIRIHVIIKGRIGEAWLDLDDHLRLPKGTTLGKLVEVSTQFAQALAESPHLVDTMMLNGERCPFGENSERVLADGDELYLLAPLAGG